MKILGYPTMAAITVVFCGAIATAQAPRDTQRPSQSQAPTTSTRQPSANIQDTQTLKDVEATFGFVPQWIKQVPAALLPSFWMTLKNFQMSDQTALDKKTKELVGLAVAAQIPCEYCVMFHTEVARMNGASDQEIREAIGMAAVTREASTLLNGMAIDKAQFRRDLDRMVRTENKRQAKR